MEKPKQRTSLQSHKGFFLDPAAIPRRMSAFKQASDLQLQLLPKKKIRRKLIQQVQQILKNLQDDLQQDWQQVLSRLREIQQQAKKFNVEDISRLSVFSILKERLERLEKDVETSTYEKRNVANPFREARIDQMDYEALEEKKLAERTFLVYPNRWGKGFKPFMWGNGFNSEDKYDLRKISRSREKYSYAFKYIKYEQTVKQVNKIFFKGYKDLQAVNRQSIRNTQYLLISIVLLIALALLFQISTGIQTNNTVTQLTGLASVLGIFASELYLSVRKFKHRPSQQTEIEKTRDDVKWYFEDLNKEIMRDEKVRWKYRWKCPEEFLYLEVQFVGEVPMGP